jgi:hypothetical protein
MALQPISVRGGLGLAYQPFTREIAASVVVKTSLDQALG